MKKIFGVVRFSFWFILFGALFCAPGCQTGKAPAPSKTEMAPHIKIVVVLGFSAVLTEGERPRMIRAPLSGSVVAAEPVSVAVVDKMTEILFEKMVSLERYQLVSPGQAKGVSSSILESNQYAGLSELRVLQKIGLAFGADAVLAGQIYRWQERKGTDFAANRAASVAFDLQMVRPTDGTILWKGKFNKTQRSLAENLFDLALFEKGKGRWLTAEKLARIGIEELMDTLPKEQ